MDTLFSAQPASKAAELSEQQWAAIRDRLGREPRGLVAVERWDQAGLPALLRVAPLVEQKPFPTLFWLIQPERNYAIDQLEASGIIARWQRDIEQCAEHLEALQHYHHWYIEERWQTASPSQQRELEQLGFRAELDKKGVGGIGDFSRIRCLHTWYAAHLVKPNPIGSKLEQAWSGSGPE